MFPNVKVTTDHSLPWVDFSTLAAIAKCTRYGMVKYRHNKHMREYVDNDNLTAGTAAHNFFAAYNIYGNDHLLMNNLFTRLQLDNMYGAAEAAYDSGSDKARIAFALEALYQSPELPDARSKKKSPDKIEKACLYWAERQTHNRVIAGVELEFDITINDTFRYIGKIDCLQIDRKGNLVAVEYKTASRIDEKYILKWQLSPQVTGYHLALSTYCTAGILPYTIAEYVELEAQALPITKAESTLPHMKEPYRREELHYYEFFRWLDINYAKIIDNTYPSYDAPINPESCYAYNSICSMLHEFCTVDREDRKEIFENELIVKEWHPHKEV